MYVTPTHSDVQHQILKMTTSPPTGDVANNVNIPVPGWPRLAQNVAANPGMESFPNFADLSIKSLMYYQAELIYLRKRLHQAEFKDYCPSTDYSSNLHKLILAREKAIIQKDDGLLPEQWILLERIRTTLEKYHAALLKLSEVAALREADNCNVRTLRKWVKGCCKDGLQSTGSLTWGETAKIDPKPKTLPQLFWGLFTGFFVSPDGERDCIADVFQEHLVVPHKGSKQDGLTQWVRQSFIPFWDLLWKDYLCHVWHFLQSLWHGFLRFWHSFLRLCHSILGLRRPLRPENQPKLDEENLEKLRASMPSSNDSSRNGSSSPTLTNSNGSMPPASPTLTNNSFKSHDSLSENTHHYSGEWIVRTTSIITTTVACLLPVVAITILARVHSMGLILGLIAIFTAIFSIGLVLISSSSSRVEIFTATAAFSAVMVVFVQNQIGPN